MKAAKEWFAPGSRMFEPPDSKGKATLALAEIIDRVYAEDEKENA